MSLTVKGEWRERLIIWLVIPFIKNVLRPYLIMEIVSDQIVLATMTTKEDKTREDENPTQYVIAYEEKFSKYYGSLINFNTLLIMNQTDLLRVSTETYRGRKVYFTSHVLNQEDFANFKEQQRDYYQDPEKQKRLTKIIFSFSTKNER
jgi:hypothetical protein